MFDIWFIVRWWPITNELWNEDLFSLFFVTIFIQIYLVNVIPIYGFTNNKKITCFCYVTFYNLDVSIFIRHQDSVDFMFFKGVDHPKVADVRFQSLESNIGPQSAKASVLCELVGFFNCFFSFSFNFFDICLLRLKLIVKEFLISDTDDLNGLSDSCFIKLKPIIFGFLIGFLIVLLRCLVSTSDTFL